MYIDFSLFTGHSHNLLELEAEKWRCTVTQAMQHLKQFVDNVQETARSLERIQQEIIPTHNRPEQGMFFILFFLHRTARYIQLPRLLTNLKNESFLNKTINSSF